METLSATKVSALQPSDGTRDTQAKVFKALAQVFASELDAVVFGIDYRLAPEHPFPKPLDDCTDALQWVRKLCKL
jgi:acetyl esterase/lipase